MQQRPISPNLRSLTHLLPLTLVLCAFLVAVLPVGDAAATTKSGHDPADPYREVRITWDEAMARSQTITDMNLEVMGLEPGGWIKVLCRNDELDRLRAAGVPFEILVDDLETFYAERLGARDDNFGIFHTYSETVEFMQQLHADYPDLTTDLLPIGYTWEGRIIYAMKISDNPDLEEPDEPEVLFDAMHHAREIMTVEVLINYMTWLCENYGTDPDATQLVDTRQIWFVPLINVDGFVYNEQTNPNGGGMWRKTRRDDLGGCIGVDPNRNYGYQWGGPGSSPDPCSETYRGPEAFSEFCVQAMRNLMNEHHFVTGNSYHSVAALVLFPWGYTSTPTPDDDIFRSLAIEMTRDNGYVYGQPPNVLYVVSGGSFDWAYGEQGSKPKMFSFSTEVGGSGFWPAESEAPGLLAENHYSNIVVTRAAGVYLTLDDFAVVGGNGNGRLDPGETAQLVVTVANQGVIADASGVTVSLASDDPYLALATAAGTIGAIPAAGTGDNSGDPFVLAADPATPDGHMADLTVVMRDDAGFEASGTVTLLIGNPTVVYGQDFEIDASGWEQDPSHTATTGAFVRIDPIATTYQPGDDTTPPPGVYAWITGQNPGGQVGTDDVDNGVSATRTPVFDLSALASARLSLMWFHGQRDPGDDSGDFFRIDLSNDGGASYPANLVTIGDISHPAQWEELNLRLEDYLPLTGQMRLRIQASDGPAVGDIVEAGIDDFYILDGGSGNLAPGAPALLSPPNGAGNLPGTPTLEVTNAVDPEGDPLTYAFRVYADELLTQVVAEVEGVAEGAGGSTAWTVSPGLANGTYYWRAYAADPELRGPYMAAAMFEVGQSSSVVDGHGDVPGRPVLASPMPNPFSSGTVVSYSVDSRSRIRLDIFDVNGRHVRCLVEGVVDAGVHLRDWDGQATDGRRAPAGVYLVQLEVNGVRQTQKLIRLP